MTGVGVQPVAASSPAYGRWLEPGSFHQHIGRRGRDHRIPPAHHPGKAERLHMIGHNQVFWIEDALHAIQGLQPFALAGPSHHDAAFNLVQVKGMRWLPHRQPGEVRRIYGVGNLFLFEQAEVRRNLGAWEPVTRFADGDATQHAGREPPALVLRLDRDGKILRGRPGLWKVIGEIWQRQSVDCSRLTGHAMVVHRVHAVGCYVHLEERAVSLAEIVDPFDRNAAQSQVLGELSVINGKSGKVCTKPFCKYLHFLFSLSASQQRFALRQVSKSARIRGKHSNQSID